MRCKQKEMRGNDKIGRGNVQSQALSATAIPSIVSSPSHIDLIPLFSQALTALHTRSTIGVVAACKPRKGKAVLAAALAARTAMLRMMELLLHSIIEVFGVKACYGEGVNWGKGRGGMLDEGREEAAGNRQDGRRGGTIKIS